MLWSFEVKENSANSWKAGQDTSGPPGLFSIAMKLVLDQSHFHSQNEAIAQLVKIVGNLGQITEIRLTPVVCRTCGWIHDPAFHQIKANGREIYLLGGVLSEIVAAVHHAHAIGRKGLNTKDEELVKICGGYKNPCKAFEDKKHRDDYKTLFFTRKRGFISLRTVNKLETEERRIKSQHPESEISQINR